MRFVEFADVVNHFSGKSIAIVGSAPSVLKNEPGFIDSHDLVVRVNNYKVGKSQGFRCDVHYSFYGQSIRKSAEELKRDGVSLCLCKCPNSMPIYSEWHYRTGKIRGIDFRYIYQMRERFWFCDTYVPDETSFLKVFRKLGNHIPTTGFAAITEIIRCQPKSIYLTGFDFFTSGIHNVDEAWRKVNRFDPIRHVPKREADWLRQNGKNHPMTYDAALSALLGVEHAV